MQPEAFPSLAAWYRDACSGLAQEHRSGGSVPVGLIRTEQPEPARRLVNPAVPELVLVVGLDADAPFRWNPGDGWTPEVRLRPGEMVLVPPETVAEFDIGGPRRMLQVTIPVRAVAPLLAGSEARGLAALAPLHGPVLRDQVLRAAVLRMWSESQLGGHSASLMIDGLMVGLLGQLLRRATQAPAAAALTLPQRTIARIDGHIDAHMETALDIPTLAALAGCSATHFARRFRAATGQTPQYVIDRRIERARELLAEGELPLSEIAYACGFASQSHMTDVFRQRVGLTPGRYRRGRAE